MKNKEESAVYTSATSTTSEDDKVIQQALDILRRRCKRGNQIHNPDDVWKFFALELAGREREVFGCLFLDTRHRVIAFEELFLGTIDSASVHPREVARACLRPNAHDVILVHNHPSGKPEPSSADVALTEKLKKALALIDVRVLDHVVVAAEGHVSLSERGLI